jgi:multidrug resistance efflux pump
MHYLCYGQVKQTKHSAKPFLNLGFTQVQTSVDGYIANLDLRLGSQAVANQPALALVDSASFWVHGYLRETMIARVAPGDRAVITLMTYPDRPLRGRVDRASAGASPRATAAPATTNFVLVDRETGHGGRCVPAVFLGLSPQQAVKLRQCLLALRAPRPRV